MDENTGQSRWAANVGGLLGGIFGNNGAADEIAAIGGLGKGGPNAPISVSGSPEPVGSMPSLLILGGIVIAIIIVFMVLKN